MKKDFTLEAQTAIVVGHIWLNARQQHASTHYMQHSCHIPDGSLQLYGLLFLGYAIKVI